MGNSIRDATWFDHSAKYIALALLAVAVVALVVIAFARTSASGAPDGAAPRPMPTFSQAPDALRTVTVTPTDGTLDVLFAGDSLTGGLYASDQANGFKWRMATVLEQSGPVKEYNSALSGGTTVQVSEEYDVPTGLDLAVVELGTNDLGNQVPLDEFRTVYSELLTKITVSNPGVPVVCAGVWEGNGGGPEGPTYDRVIEQACSDVDGVFVSLRALYQNPDTIGPAGQPAYLGTSDDFHPNDRGHELIAAALLERITLP